MELELILFYGECIAPLKLDGTILTIYNPFSKYLKIIAYCNLAGFQDLIT